MSPRFTQSAQGGASALIPVTPRRDRISSATVPGRRRGTVALVSSALREEERGLLIPLGLWARISIRRHQGGGEVSPLRSSHSREEERSNLSSLDRSGPVFATTTPGRRRGIVAVVEGLREERPSEFLCLAACFDRQAADHGAAQTQVGQFAVRKLVQLIICRAINAVLTEAFCCVREKDRKARGFRCGHRRCACYICHCHFSQSARVSVRCCVSDIAGCCTCTIAALAKQPCAQRIADVTSR